MRLILTVAAAALLAACEAPAPDAADQAAAADMADALRVAPGWTTGGCGDVLLYGRNANDTRAFFVNLPGMATDSHTAGRIRQTYTLPSPDVSVTAEDGFRLTATTCVGMQPPRGPRVTRSWEAVSGSLTVDVNPTGLSPSATATVTARNVVFSDGAGLTFTATSLRVPVTSVGFYPP
jgi:hypothetical protein